MSSGGGGFDSQPPIAAAQTTSTVVSVGGGLAMPVWTPDRDDQVKSTGCDSVTGLKPSHVNPCRVAGSVIRRKLERVFATRLESFPDLALFNAVVK